MQTVLQPYSHLQIAGLLLYMSVAKDLFRRPRENIVPSHKLKCTEYRRWNRNKHDALHIVEAVVAIIGKMGYGSTRGAPASTKSKLARGATEQFDEMQRGVLPCDLLCLLIA